MSNIYRIYPTLWENANMSYMVYAIDRSPPSGTFPTQCSVRPRADPASVWDSPTFQRLLPSTYPTSFDTVNAVTWSNLMSWISWIQIFGYTLSENTNLTKLKPNGEIYIVGP